MDALFISVILCHLCHSERSEESRYSCAEICPKMYFP